MTTPEMPTAEILAAEEFRRHFPSLTDMVYLASCSHGALSDALETALLEYQHTIREHGAPWLRWMEEVDLARRMFADLIGAIPDEIAVVPCASAAAYQIASTQNWQRRPRIVTTDMEFPSVAHVWLAQQASGSQVVHVTEHQGQVDPAEYEDAIGESCGLVSVPLISYRNGLRLPVKEIVHAARQAGARTFVDAYQAAGVEPIDVRELDCDYLTSGTLKYMLGTPGIAFLYVRAGLKDLTPPQNTGWFGRVDPFNFDSRHIDYPPHARRFETGTPSIPSAFGAVAGMRMISMVGPAAIQAHIRELTQILHDRLVDAGVPLYSPSDPRLRGPQVAVMDPDPEALSRFLAERRIITSPRGDVLRVSLHYYNTISDIDALVSGVQEYRRC